MNSTIEDLNKIIYEKSEFITRLTDEIGKVIVGQKYMVERILLGILADGHILLEGVPGLAKTMTINTVSNTISTKFQRIQFTPDLLPADLIGTLIYSQQKGEFEVKKGPIFANLILADEINRSPSKVQSALLEAMMERQVTIGDQTYKLDAPFLVMATQNPVEQEGTYPLPEAQVDRFMLKVQVTYPKKEEELLVLRRMSTGKFEQAKSVVEIDEIVKAREIVKEIYMDEKIENYILDIVHATREPARYGLPQLEDLIEFGASPRASINLAMAGRAFAFLKRRGYVIPEDIRSIAMDILRHRVILTYEAEAEEMTSEDIVTQILNKIEVP
ncbi:MAG: MoxR family ATPase [Calditrichaeota bacterium]|nr:MAG: MoxR family ATPase [Calditrichota bacterium]